MENMGDRRHVLQLEVVKGTAMCCHDQFRISVRSSYTKYQIYIITNQNQLPE